MAHLAFRRATTGDEPFLREMLFEAPFVPLGADPLPRVDLEAPEITHYVDGYGRPGDLGVIALADEKPVGAAWVRQLDAADPGYGYVDDETPELTIAVTPEWRGRGVGERLMLELINAAHTTVPAVSLSCDPENPAMRLYERLGFVAVGESGTSITMLKPLPTEVRATDAHEIPDRAPLQVAVGDVVQVGERDTEWPEFVFVTATSGTGWIPARHLEIDGERANVRAAYDTTELPTVAGELLAILRRDDLSGWLWCQAETGREGWVPSRTVEPG
jgi:ribosomal protein S18 acetylase RimI-like enzyme